MHTAVRLLGVFIALWSTNTLGGPIEARDRLHDRKAEEELQRATRFWEEVADASSSERGTTYRAQGRLTGGTGLLNSWRYNADWLYQNRIKLWQNYRYPDPAALKDHKGQVHSRLLFPALLGLSGVPDRNMPLPKVWSTGIADKPPPGLSPNKTIQWKFEHDRGKLKDLGSSVAVFSALPTSIEQFRRVFNGGRPTALDLATYQRASRRLDGVGVKVADIDAGLSAPGRLFLIVGHNDNGQLRLVDGSPIRLADISERCEHSFKICVFLVCNGREHVGSGSRSYGRAITPTEAARIAYKIQSVLDRHNSHRASIDSFYALNEILYVTSDKHGIIYMYKGVGPLIVVSLILFVQCEQDNCYPFQAEHG